MDRPIPVSVEAVALAVLAREGPLLHVTEDDTQAEALAGSCGRSCPEWRSR